MRHIAILLALVAAWSCPVAAQTPRPVSVSLEVSAQEPNTKGPIRVRAIVRILPGWHVNSHRPLQDFLIPTRLTLTPPPGWRVLEVRYPPAIMRRFAFAGDAALSVWENEAVIEAQLETGALMPDAPILASLRYQACSNRVCLPPDIIDAGTLSLMAR